MARYAKNCTDDQSHDAFVEVRDTLIVRGYEVLSGEYGAGLLVISTNLPVPQDILDLLSLEVA